MDDKKISRKGFLGLVFGGIVGIMLSQLPAKSVFAKTQKGGTYGNEVYGGSR